mgnify:FL=1|jgi:hypothetical protein
MAKYYITPTLLNSWQYNIKNGTLEDFIKVLNKEQFEATENILKGFAYEKYMQENYSETLGGAYQVKVSKEYGDYLLYGIIDCLKGGIIYDYKYTANYEVGKFFNNHQTLMYLEMVPEARKMVYLITNKFEKIEYADNNFKDIKSVAYDIGDIFREEYTKDLFPETIESVLYKFIAWLKAYNLYDLYTEKWKCKN